MNEFKVPSYSDFKRLNEGKEIITKNLRKNSRDSLNMLPSYSFKSIWKEYLKSEFNFIKFVSDKNWIEVNKSGADKISFDFYDPFNYKWEENTGTNFGTYYGNNFEPGIALSSSLDPDDMDKSVHTLTIFFKRLNLLQMVKDVEQLGIQINYGDGWHVFCANGNHQKKDIELLTKDAGRLFSYRYEVKEDENAPVKNDSKKLEDFLKSSVKKIPKCKAEMYN